MNEPRMLLRVSHAAIFAALCGMVVFARLLPLDGPAGGWPPPDLIAALVIAWTIRRPDLLPVWLIAAVVFLADLALMRPPGLWSALVVLASEALRQRSRALQTLPLIWETLLAGAVLAGLVMMHWLVLAALLVQQPALWQLMLQVPLTLAVYPLVVAVLHGPLGLRKQPVPEGFGRRRAA